MSLDAESETVEVERTETKGSYRYRTEFLRVEIEKGSLRLRAETADGKVLLHDLQETVFSGGEIAAERLAGVTERFFGLGARSDTGTNVRRQRITTTTPFLMSSLGYGLYHASPGKYVFELADSKPDRYRVLVRGSGALDFNFYYGPSPKEVLEEHKKAAGSPELPHSWQFGVIRRNQAPKGAVFIPPPGEPSWSSLRGALRSIINASMSAILLPVLDLTPYFTAPAALFARATQLAAVSPILVADNTAALLEPGKLESLNSMVKFRKRLQSHLLAYAAEASTSGIPIIHPLPLQFPNDAEAAKADDAFMLGDEILVAPVCADSVQRQVYLPMGLWTDLRTNQVHRGRQTIEIEASVDEIPMFAKSGSIVVFDPEAGSGSMELHYFPKLAAEFFLYEPDIREYSQLHAGPAGDSIRLEIESKKDRLYEWVVRHVPPAREAVSGGVKVRRVDNPEQLRPGSWWYDARQGNVHVRLQAGTAAQAVVFLNF